MAMPNLYEQQKRNQRRTVFVVFGFILFTALVGMSFDALMFGTNSTDPFFPYATVAALTLSIGTTIWSVRGGTDAVMKSAQAFRANRKDLSHQQLLNVVDEMRIAAGIPMPRVYVVPDSDPNAFAAGMIPENAAIAVTEGLLATLNRDELQGVVAHEISHIRNYDTQLMTAVSSLVGTVVILADLVNPYKRPDDRPSYLRRGRSDPLDKLVTYVFFSPFILLAPLVARILAMLVSRQREYIADASAAELTRNPLGLTSALDKIEFHVKPTVALKRGTAHLCIVDPLGIPWNNKEGFFADLLGTHPPIKRRIQFLKAMAYQHPAGG